MTFPPIFLITYTPFYSTPMAYCTALVGFASGVTDYVNAEIQYTYSICHTYSIHTFTLYSMYVITIQNTVNYLYT